MSRFSIIMCLGLWGAGCVVDPAGDTANGDATDTADTRSTEGDDGGDGDGDAECANVAWALEPVVSSDNGRTTMLALDGGGRPVVLFQEAGEWVSRTRDGDTWAPPVEIGRNGDDRYALTLAHSDAVGLMFAGTEHVHAEERTVVRFAEMPSGASTWAATTDLNVAAPFGQGAIHDATPLLDTNAAGQSIITWQEFTGVELQRFMRTRSAPGAAWSSVVTLGAGWGQRPQIDAEGDVWSAEPSADFTELNLARWSNSTRELDSPSPIALTSPGPAMDLEVVVAGNFVAIAWREWDPGAVIAYAAVYDIAEQAWIGVEWIDGNQEYAAGAGRILDYKIVGDAAGNVLIVLERTTDSSDTGIIHWRRFDAETKQWGEVQTIWEARLESWDMHLSMNAAGDAVWSKRTLDAVEMSRFRASEQSWGPVSRFERPSYWGEDQHTTVITPDGQGFVAWSEFEGPERGVHVARACF